MNPGSRRGKRYLPRIERLLRTAGVGCEVVVSERPGHLAELVRQPRESVDAVLVLGGDGSVMEVVTALAGTSTPVGVLPGGTGNLIAGALGVPRRPERAVRALLAGSARRFDLGRLDNGVHFAFAAGVGIDATMVMETSSVLKKRFGVLAYTAAAARAALRRDAFELEARVDDVTVRVRATLAMVANFGSVFRGLFFVGPGVRADDGRLVLCVFSPRSVGDVLAIAWRMLRGDFRPHRAMQFLGGSRIELACDPPRPVQADGDVVGQTPVQITVEPLAATFLVPG